MLDSGGARSMIDLQAAKKMGLPIERARKGKMFGSFFGPGNREIPYYGRIKGPVEVQVSAEAKLVIPQLKVFKHGEPLLLVGTDVLTD